MTHNEIEEPATTRRQQLSPASPRPQNVPSPANIPILELQMDPNYDDNSHNNGTSTPASQQYASQSQTPNPSASTPHFSDPSTTANSSYQHVGTQGVAGGGAPGFYAQSAQYGGSTGTQAQDNSSMNFSAQQQARDAPQTQTQTQTPGQNLQSAYPYAHNTAPAQSAQGSFQAEGNAGASVDVQALLDSFAQSSQYSAPQMSPQSMQAQQPTASAASLPPRPPTQDQSANHNASDDIRSFHPHSQLASNPQQRAGNGQLQPLNTRGQNYSSIPHGGAQSPRTPGNTQQSQQGLRSETPDDEDIRWPPEINRKYEEFLEQERKFVTEGQWDQFPNGSRLFIGNLPTEKVTKRDIFHRFYRHGALAQISIKQAYGFVQFLDSPSCRRALDAEQGQAVRGRKMHLEVSKPQKNSRKAEQQSTGARRRSRSPDYTRGGNTSTPRDGRYGGNAGPMSPRERDRRFRDRDDFRPMRSPSPRGMPRGMRPRDRSRSRDRYDSRFRSRSRSPPRRRRSPSPRQDYTEDELDLRRRLPHEVPDIQILVLHEGISRDFIRYAEDVFRQQGLRSNVLIMSGRFPEPAVVRRQIIEGVLAIVRMDTSGFTKGKIGVQIFDRRGGASNVQFNEYADLDPTTVALLVNTAKQNQSQPVQSIQPPVTAPAFGFNGNMPPFNQPAPGHYLPTLASQPNMSSMIASLDPASLSQLLGAMSGNNGHQNPQPAPSFNADLARLLAQVSGPTQTPSYSSQPHAPAQPMATQFGQFPGLASLFASQPQIQLQPQSQPQSQPAAPPVQSAPPASAPPPDMSEIMAQLAQYQR